MSRRLGFIVILATILLASSCSNDAKVVENTVNSTSATTTSETAASETTTTAELVTGVSISETTPIAVVTTVAETTVEFKTTAPIETSAPIDTTTSSTEEPKISGTVNLVDDDSLNAIENLQTTAQPTVQEPSTGTESAVGSTTVYYKSSLSDKAWDFINECVFVGDSICSGFKAYDILSTKNVLAVGNTAARNIFEDWVSFKVNGTSMDLISALAAKQPKYVIFSMGMNDVNMTTKEQFCANYDSILKKAREVLPDSTFYIFSITPITYKDDGRIFTYNSTIDNFNAALKAHLEETGTATFIDVAPEMKNSKNLLRADYLGSPDGVHLAPAAYYAMLYQFIDQVFD